MKPVGRLALLLLVAGCAPQVPEGKVPSLPQGFPADFYRQAAAKGEEVYAVERSRLQVRVYRAGPLARFGHDHLIASTGVQGYAELAGDAVRTDLYLPLDSLAVTDPELSPADAAATRRNMLDKVLEAGPYPFALVHGTCRLPCPALEAELTLHGVTRQMAVPLRWRQEGNRLEAEGRFDLRHGDFAMTPYRVLAGALQVAETVELDFRVETSALVPGGKDDAETGAAVGN